MFKPNLGRPMRVLYAVFGMALAVSPLLLTLDPWLRYLLPVLGVVSLAEGLAGW